MINFIIEYSNIFAIAVTVILATVIFVIANKSIEKWSDDYENIDRD